MERRQSDKLILEAVKSAVKETVNGKIDSLRQEVNSAKEELHKRLDKQDDVLEVQNKTLEEMKPLLEAKKSFFVIRDFFALIFKGVFTIGALTGAYLTVKKLF